MVSATFEDSGNNQPSVGEMLDVLSAMPRAAKITSLHVENSQMDGWWWRVQAREEVVPQKPLNHHHGAIPPGYTPRAASTEDTIPIDSAGDGWG